ncbi:MAG: hypothetical protein A2W31_02105 [Planctomycetes bacterium RBG_16_64_10]|nr:MAG: hypothetical protein A2W31_02105 [Planctomycetes bacterium RBG_16_64_10]
MACQFRDIVPAFAQRWQMEREDGDAVPKVCAERAVSYHLTKPMLLNGLRHRFGNRPLVDIGG